MFQQFQHLVYRIVMTVILLLFMVLHAFSQKPNIVFNLTDPGESINLQAKHPDKVKELRTLPDKYIKQGRSVAIGK